MAASASGVAGGGGGGGDGGLGAGLVYGFLTIGVAARRTAGFGAGLGAVAVAAAAAFVCVVEVILAIWVAGRVRRRSGRRACWEAMAGIIMGFVCFLQINQEQRAVKNVGRRRRRKWAFARCRWWYREWAAATGG